MKIKLLFCGICLIALSSCASKSGNNADSTVVDSTLTDTLVSDSVAETEPAPVYLSDDLKKFGLKGRVTKVTHKFKGDDWVVGIVDDDLVFDAEGKLTSKTPDLTLTVNGDGFISKLIDTMGSTDGSTATSTFTKLDENGWPIVVKSKYSSPDSDGYADFTITYPEIDDHGNWTKCVFKGTKVYIHPTTEDEFADPFKITMVRTITY